MTQAPPGGSSGRSGGASLLQTIDWGTGLLMGGYAYLVSAALVTVFFAVDVNAEYEVGLDDIGPLEYVTTGLDYHSLSHVGAFPDVSILDATSFGPIPNEAYLVVVLGAMAFFGARASAHTARPDDHLHTAAQGASIASGYLVSFLVGLGFMFTQDVQFASDLDFMRLGFVVGVVYPVVIGGFGGSLRPLSGDGGVSGGAPGSQPRANQTAAGQQPSQSSTAAQDQAGQAAAVPSQQSGTAATPQEGATATSQSAAATDEAASGAAETERRCSTCNALANPEEAFCSNCGSKLTD